ncbi:alpha/beta hydrolase [Actinoplanes solisilvae]|uniref:alpha/beta hydrolase n=1 Tax=Actinoplanes solisilvae TaxID=2486853 RepID=UPI000FD820F0|nr:alpha/beta fold hydrolase [Actinoplanes solisilvae]
MLAVTVNGRRVVARVAAPAPGGSKPLIAALHGGMYTGRYFDIDGYGNGSFMDLAVSRGYAVAAFDRPGYGDSFVPTPDENSFEQHAVWLADAIGQTAQHFGTDRVFLVGHSIGACVAMTIAARDRDFRLSGLSMTGMGAVIPPGGNGHALAEQEQSEAVEIPFEQRDLVMFGPEHTRTETAVKAAHAAYNPVVPVCELVQAPHWPAEKLPGVAPRINVPVQSVLAEHDALIESTPANVELFASMFTQAPFVEAGIARSTGHSIDHHILGHALHLRQLAFAEECELWETQQPR